MYDRQPRPDTVFHSTMDVILTLRTDHKEYGFIDILD
jgi:hypothetical protein